MFKIGRFKTIDFEKQNTAKYDQSTYFFVKWCLVIYQFLILGESLEKDIMKILVSDESDKDDEDEEVIKKTKIIDFSIL